MGRLRTPSSRSRAAAGFIVAAFLLTVVAVIPAWAEPFSAPKRIVLEGATAISALVLPWWRRRLTRWQTTVVLFASALAVLTLLGSTRPWARWDSALLELAGASSIALWVASEVDAEVVIAGLAVGGALISSFVVLQAVGLDPFRAWHPGKLSARLALYGTMGNPDFVASLLLPLVCVSGDRALTRSRGRPWFVAATLVQLVALAMIRSLASIASLAVAVATIGTRARRHLIAGGIVLLCLVACAAQRSVQRTIDGRLYLWRVALPNLFEAPCLGDGPGAIESRWPGWELDWWKARCGLERTCVERSIERSFTGAQDHLHNDWLERAMEVGVPGGVILLGLAASLLALAWRASLGTRCALVALFARACVDFPLARPADLCLLSALAALTAAQSEGKHEARALDPDAARHPVESG